MRLHVFEPEYQDMVSRCEAGHSPFGVVFSQKGRGGKPSAPEPLAFGCTARVESVEALPGGRKKLFAYGEDRFQILQLNRDRPYPVADVENVVFEPCQEDMLTEFGRTLRPWVVRYFEILVRAGQPSEDMLQLPSDPLRLGFLAASVIDVPSIEKQHLLTTLDPKVFFRALTLMYRREVGVLRRLMARDWDRLLKNIPLN